MKTYVKRQFLNKESGMAAAQISFKLEREDEWDAEFLISDCNRNVRLDLSFWNRKMKRDRVRKLDILIQMAQELKQKIEETKPTKYG
jgi:hypothetical protein